MDPHKVDRAPALVPRGMRLNNPGNIFHSSSKWVGIDAYQPDPEIVQFREHGYGLRAMAVLLANYFRRHKLRTITQVLERYAPSKDPRNKTSAYIRFVEKASGLPATAALKFDHALVLLRVLPAMVRFEQGYQPFPLSDYLLAIEAAGLEVSL